MNREDFIAHFHHEFFGIILEANRTTETGGPLGKMLELWMKKIDMRLGQAWDRLQTTKPADKPAQPAVNGHKQETVKR